MGATMKIRLTRRGRVVFATLATLVILTVIALAALLSSPSATATDRSPVASSAFGYVVVQPGDTLWSVATSLDSSADPRDLIAEMIRLNQLSGSDVQAGTPIAVPLRYADVSGVVSAEELGI